MKPLTADQIRSSFVNCSQTAAKRISLPDLDGQPWDDLDLLGWADPSGSTTSYLVTERADGTLIGFLLKQARPRAGTSRQGMCSLCRTVHPASDIALMTATRPGPRGRAGDSRGNYLCADLACSLYVRGRKLPARVQPAETLTPEQKVARLQRNLAALVAWLGAE
ncbi:FBP domain-containing protein [Aestuariimicrobium ganziense]|uniref:FBP domain-containing protein n=1 Tax=Aestuariimicrobium ganziense TaxID=2773677 RepID=UPI0019449892|nr:FBP domain-containing protein [Aestuariimicrobium ganziense]